MVELICFSVVHGVWCAWAVIAFLDGLMDALCDVCRPSRCARKRDCAAAKWLGVSPIDVDYFLLADFPLVSLRPVFGGEACLLAPVRGCFTGLGDGFFVAIISPV